MFETVSFHIVKPCNMKCKFCYATFEDSHVGKQLSAEDAMEVILKLIDGGVQKITFAGGEPMLYKHLDKVIMLTKAEGVTTSIITNGSLITGKWLLKMRGHLDWIGLSVDSTNTETNEKIGRTAKRFYPYNLLIPGIHNAGYKLKINTVVNRYNWQEDMNKFIEQSQPQRWKVFQTLRVEGQNDTQFEEIKATDEQFKSFIERHKSQSALVPEDNELMTGSYLLVDPLGRLFENSAGKHTYSDSLINNPLNKCLSQINLNREMFLKRGGIYQW